MQERASFASLARALSVEFAGHMRGVCVCQYSSRIMKMHRKGRLVLLLLGGLRGPPKPMSRKWALDMRPCGPPGTGMGPLPFAPAILPFAEACRKSLEGLWLSRGGFEAVPGEKGVWCEKAPPCCSCGGGGRSSWSRWSRWGLSRSGAA